MATVFHNLVSVEEALEMIEAALNGVRPLGVELVKVGEALGRTLAEDVVAKTAAPPFDRSTVDGYAVIASDTYAATEETPVALKVVGKAEVGHVYEGSVTSGGCVEIATGAVIPRGANAVVMVEFTKKTSENTVQVFRPVSPAENIAQAGSDISVGDIILRKGSLITPREIAVLTSVGIEEVPVYRKVKAAVFSTGNEVVEPGKQLELGKVYDVNGPTLTAMLAEAGAQADFHGILPDDYQVMLERIGMALKTGYDVVVTSGSTSAGFGDMVYRVFNELSNGKVLVHGLKVRPGKPTAVAVAGGKLLFGLPGFPLSAMMVFMKLVKPIVMRMSGITLSTSKTVRARLPFKVEAGKGKLDMIPVQIVTTGGYNVAYPLLGHSGSTYVLSVADGVVEVAENREFLDEGEEVDVSLLSDRLKPADLIIIGSHCPGIDILLEMAGLLETKVVNVGSVAGWYAVKRGEADIAGTHLLDEKTGDYNLHMLEKLSLKGKAVVVRGYARRIGFVTKKGNPLKIHSFQDLLREDVMMVNRIRGSGIRALLDVRLAELGVKEPFKQVRGYDYEARTHTGVAAAVAHGRADVGITLEAIAKHYGLDFIPIADEMFDFAVSKQRIDKPHVKKFMETLSSKKFAETLEKTLPGYHAVDETGNIIGDI
ncbi:MAG: molybdopterin biosynthesis protein [Candidatus Caldarchaeum sp.]|uniref:Molybdopterin biosynthesis protein n=1 Tax=Caldiarchaeum subterraneum TaxID=311458 RepID=A0A7C5QF35_CALS0